MGKKLEAVKQQSDKGKEVFKAGQELGKKAVSDTKQMKSLIDSLPTDVDEEIVEAAKAVEQGTKADAEGYMHSEVQSKVNEGSNKIQESSTQAKDQIRNNDQVMRTFAEMDGVGSFGKGARDTGRGNVERFTQEFNNAIAENDRSVTEAQQEFEKELSDISGTF